MTADLLVALAVKSSLVAIIALASSRLLRQRPAREQVTALRAGTIALFALPCAALLFPSLDIALPADSAPMPLSGPWTGAEMPPAVSPSGALPSSSWTIPAVYACGVLFLTARLLAGLVTVSGWTRRSIPVVEPRWLAALDRGCRQARRRARLMVSAEISSPLSWRLWPAIILIDRKTLGCPDRADAVIAHELAHVRGLDWPALLLSRATTAILWFNPLVWIVERALTRRIEIAADEGASERVEPVAYAQMLIDTANGTQAAVPACGMASPPSQLAERVRRILSARPKRPAGRMAPMAILCSAALLIAPIAAARLVPVAPMTMPERPQVLERANDAVATPPPPTRTAAVEFPPAQRPRPTRSAQAPRSRRPSQSPGTQPPASLPVDQRQAAWEMSEQARALRNQAAEIEVATPRRGPGRDPPEPARLLRAEADRLDMAARRLIFGP